MLTKKELKVFIYIMVVAFSWTIIIIGATHVDFNFDPPEVRIEYKEKVVVKEKIVKECPHKYHWKLSKNSLDILLKIEGKKKFKVKISKKDWKKLKKYE